MTKMNLGTRCKYAVNCEIFKGKVTVSDVPLPIFRNVFCNRGNKGWNNCSKYMELSGNDHNIRK